MTAETDDTEHGNEQDIALNKPRKGYQGMEKVVILSAARTPIGAYCGGLKDVPAYKLAALVLNEALKRANIKPEMVDDVIIGSAYQNGECANGARMALLEAGWPDSVPGVVLDRRCCSGLDSIWIGAMKIQTGNADVIVAGGMDSMSQAELYISGEIKWGLGGIPHWKSLRSCVLFILMASALQAILLPRMTVRL